MRASGKLLKQNEYKKLNNYGFTMFELMVAIVILSFITMSGYALLNSGNLIVAKQTSLTEARNDIRVSLVQMTKDIQQSEQVKVIGDGTGNYPYIFVQSNKDEVSYSLNNKKQLVRHVFENGSTQSKDIPLIEFAESFELIKQASAEQFEIKVMVAGVEHNINVTRRIKGDTVIGNTGTVQGKITGIKEGNPPIAGATIIAKDKNTGREYWSVSDNNGNYILNLPIGDYEITASASGFWPKTEKNIVISQDVQVTKNFQLEPIEKSGIIPPNLEWLFDNEFALFAASDSGTANNPALKMEGSTCISGTTGTNAVGNQSIQFDWSTGIRNGDLYIGTGSNANNVITTTRSNHKENVPNGSVQQMPEKMQFNVPNYPNHPANLVGKGNLITSPADVSGKIIDENGKGVGGVLVYAGVATKETYNGSIQSVDNTGWQEGHGRYALYTNAQMGTIKVKPYKRGYRFVPEFYIVTGPANDMNFLAIKDSNVTQNPNIIGNHIPWTWLIDEDGYYDTIEAKSGYSVTFDLGGGDRYIRVKNLNVTQGDIKLQNVGSKGRLFIYVDNIFTFTGSSSINEFGNEQSLFIYYAGTQKINIAGNTRFKGNLFIKNAQLEIGGSAKTQGSIISGGNKIEFAGSSSATEGLIYAPNAQVNIHGSGAIKGTLVAKNIEISGGSCPAIEYKPISEHNFPSEFFAN